MSTRSAWKSCIAALILATAPVVSASSWVSTGNLTAPRGHHTATLLQSGKVLVVGGWGNSQGTILDSAELFDPGKGTWSVTGRPGLARVNHTATLLRDGRILVAGGDSKPSSGPPRFGRTATAELYDPSTGSWSPTGNMNDIRTIHTATLLQDGRVLVAGGFGLGTAEIYDPATGAWSPTGSLNAPYGLYGHTATSLPNGEVLIAGGTDDDEFCSYTNWVSTQLYNPVAGTWREAGSLKEVRLGHTATLAQNGKVLVAGGNSCDGVALNTSVLYDPVTGTWSPTGSLDTARTSHTATLLPKGEVLVAGGYHHPGPRSPAFVVAGAELYDAGRAAWDSTGSLITVRVGHTATLLPNGNVLVAGGNSTSNAYLGSAELYGPPGTIGPGFTGNWFDPAQSGHGLFVQVLPDQRFLAAWFTFDPNGAPAWFLGVGTYSGNTATIRQVEQPGGGRWIPNFDPSRIVANAWGTLTFTFTDCNRGRVDFTSVAGFGSGGMELTRLTLPAGLTCP